MGNDIRRRDASGQNLRDLQEDYRKRREEIVESNERQIDSLKREYAKKVTTEKTRSEAAINHIRTQGERQTEAVDRRYDDKISQQERSRRMEYENRKDIGERNLEQLNHNLQKKERHLADRITDTRRREADEAQRLADETQSLQKREYEKQAKINADTNKGLAQIRQQGTKARSELLAEQRSEMASLRGDHKGQTENLKNTHHQIYTDTKAQQTQHLQKLRDDQHARYEKERLEGQSAQLRMRKAHQEQIQGMSQKSEAEMKMVSTENQRALESARHRGVTAHEKVRDEYDQEIRKVHLDGDRQVAFEKARAKEKLNSQEQTYEEELQTNAQKHESNLKKQELAFKDKAQKDQALYRKTLQAQEAEFQKTFQAKQAENISTLNAQKLRLLDQIANQRKEIVKQFGQYENTGSDPFYRLQTADSQLIEEPNFYILKTKIPEHERDNVQVRVQHDRIYVNGTRAFEEKIEHPDHKLASNSYETFRQEFPLNEPVQERHAVERYENGTLTVKVPKMSNKNFRNKA